MEFYSSIFLFALILLLPKLRKAFLYPDTRREKKVREAKRYEFFDFAKGIAIIAVILIHSIYLFQEKFPGNSLYGLEVINNLSRFAVGFFFISSGALLNSGITKNKILRVFVPYIFVCILVGVFQQKSWDLIIGGVVRGDLLPPYYFIPILFQFYLIYPFQNKFRYKKYFLLITLLISYFFYLTQQFNYLFGVPFFGQFLYLFSFGLVYSEKLKGEKPFEKLDWWLLIIPAYIALQFIFPGHYYNARYFFAPAMFVAVHALWHYIKRFNEFKIIQEFGKLSLWIYLIHFSVESFFVNLIPFSLEYSVYLYVLLITGLTVVGSLLFSFVLNKVYRNGSLQRN